MAISSQDFGCGYDRFSHSSGVLSFSAYGVNSSCGKEVELDWDGSGFVDIFDEGLEFALPKPTPEGEQAHRQNISTKMSIIIHFIVFTSRPDQPQKRW